MSNTLEEDFSLTIFVSACNIISTPFVFQHAITGVNAMPFSHGFQCITAYGKGLLLSVYLDQPALESQFLPIDFNVVP